MRTTDDRPVVRAVPLGEFLSNPAGRCTIGRTWLHFCAHPELFGVVFFGRPDRADIEKLTRSLLVELGPNARRHRSLVDARRLEAADAGAFAVLHEYVRGHAAALQKRVERLALVRPEGLEGAVVVGFYGTLQSPYPVTIHDDIRAALVTLGERPSIAGELDAVVANASSVHPIVAELRALLAGRRGLASVGEVSRALGMSDRTLQRRLSEAGTTLEKEWMSARIREAQRLMLSTDEPLTAIALEAGFTSLQHFSTQFRKATGETPSAWRDGRRRG